MTDLTAAQQRTLRTDRVHVRDVADTAIALFALLEQAHLGAALTTTPDTPSSKWAGGGTPGAGTISDPTGNAAMGDQRTDELLGRLRRALADWRDAGYHAHRLATQLAAKLEPDEKPGGWQGDLDLDQENMGAGRCDACDRDVAGTRADRLVTFARKDRGVDLRGCPACYRDWRRALDRDFDADFGHWLADRNRRHERTDGRESA